MPETLTREQILVAAEDVLRRFGPAKATVVDVARALGVSHGSVYRHFPSKVALRSAVAERWLERAHADLPGIAAADGAAGTRLRDWLQALLDAKRAKALDDPELFATYQALIPDADGLIAEHVDRLVGQLARIVGDGVAAGEFAAAVDPRVAARAVFDATARFHDPAHAAGWRDPAIDAALTRVVDLLLAGLRSGA